MTITPQQEFWRDPSKHENRSDDPRYKNWWKCCLPEWYIDGKERSMWFVGLVEKLFGPSKDTTFLELGANNGRNLHYLQESGYPNVTGVEINPETVAIGAKRWPDAAGFIHIDTIEHFVKRPTQYDIIFSMSVLMHIPPESDFIYEYISNMALKGIITIEVENSEAPDPTLKFARNYGEIFTNLGWEQIYQLDFTGQPKIGPCVTRAFKKEE